MADTTLVLNTSETFNYGGHTNIPPMHVARLSKDYAELVKRDYTVIVDVPEDEQSDYDDVTINSAVLYLNYVPTVVEPTVEPVVEETVEPTVEPIVETVEPIVETVEPTVEETVEPAAEETDETTETKPEVVNEVSTDETVETVPTSDSEEVGKSKPKRGKS